MHVSHVGKSNLGLSRQVLAAARLCRSVCAHHIAADSEKYDAEAIDMQCGSFSNGVHNYACHDHCTQSVPNRLLPHDSALAKTHRHKCKFAARAARGTRQLAVKATQENLVQVISHTFLPALDLIYKGL